MFKIEFFREEAPENIAPKGDKLGEWSRNIPICKDVCDRYSLVDTSIPPEENAWAYKNHAYLIEERNIYENNAQVDRRLIMKLHWSEDIRNDFTKDMFIALGYYLDCENEFLDIHRRLMNKEMSDDEFFNRCSTFAESERCKYLNEFSGSLEPLMNEYLFSTLIGDFDSMDNDLNAIYDFFSDLKMRYEKKPMNKNSEYIVIGHAAPSSVGITIHNPTIEWKNTDNPTIEWKNTDNPTIDWGSISPQLITFDKV